MNRFAQVVGTLCLLVLLNSPFSAAFGQGTAFTYQGSLNDGGAPASGRYDLLFTLFDTGTGGAGVAGPVTNSAAMVSNGIFTATVDFGPGVFTGNSNWLEIAVRTNGGGGFTTLAPRQQLTPAPYAIQAANATAAGTALNANMATLAGSANSVAATNISGTIPLGQLPGAIVTNNATGVTLTGTFSGNASGLTNLNASQLTSGPVPLAQLPSAVVLNNATGVTLTGTFYGNGIALTNIAATNLNNFTTYALQTNIYSSAGTNNFTVPELATFMTVKLWGGGGSAGDAGSGGGGAFSMISLPVTPGSTYTAVTGQGGASSYPGGLGSNDGEGGTGGGSTPGDYVFNGGQASSFFQFTGSHYITLAVAGGGGSCSSDDHSGGAGGNPGQSGAAYGSPYGIAGGGGYNGAGGSATSPATAGSAYASGATTTGETSLNQMGGKGGSGYAGVAEGGGGGGGFGGGGGGYGAAGGSGGGSYGNVMIGGFYSSPGNTSDPNYISPAGAGGSGSYNGGNNGLVVVIFYAQTTTTPANLAVNGSVQVSNGNVQVYNGAVQLAASNTFPQLLFLGQGFYPPILSTDTNNGPGFMLYYNSANNRQLALVDSAQIGQYTNAILRFNVGGSSIGIDAVQETNASEVNLILQGSGGKLGIGVISPTNALDVNGSIDARGNVYANGMLLTSDRNAKENFKRADSQTVLAKVAVLPITEWNYKTDSKGMQHIGPMAQDFH